MNRADFSAIETFVRVAEAGSFRRASVVLSAPASTVSVHVTRLEERLGTKLLERTTRRVSLTDEGRRFYEQVRIGLEAVIEAERSIASGAGDNRGRLRVAAPVEWGQTVLGRVFDVYVQSFPEVELEVILSEDASDPLRDGFDLVVQTEPPSSTSLTAKKLGKPMAYRLLASPAYLSKNAPPEHPRDLARHACIVMGTRSAQARWQLGARASFVHRHTTANSWTLCRDLAVAGRGIAKLPDYLGAPALAEGSLAEVLDAFRPPPEQLYAVYAKNRHAPARLRGFVAALSEHLSVWPGCLFKRPATDPTRSHATGSIGAGSRRARASS
ncbi:MAG: LysR family transcriptional regulator [Polyangiaceae bacterium]|nr:LysR family transcriptional regulator [Polyangiaceae bacterium]